MMDLTHLSVNLIIFLFLYFTLHLALHQRGAKTKLHHAKAKMFGRNGNVWPNCTCVHVYFCLNP